MTMPQALNAISRELGHGHALAEVPENSVAMPHPPPLLCVL